MAGVVFLISIPSENKEKVIVAKKNKKKSEINGNLKTNSNGFIKQPKEINEQTGLLSNKSSLSEYEIDSEEFSMKMILEEILGEFKIDNAIWSSTLDGQYLQIIFTMESDENYEKILGVLKENEIGAKYHSVVSVIPCGLYYKASTTKNEEFKDDSTQEESKKSLWSQFILSVRARPTVNQVVENIKLHAALTFDFVCLLVVATTLCAIGLVENNNVYLLSSMLISPMMGPVMAATFGTVIRDKTLRKIGIQSELLGLLIALLVGYCYGAVICLSTDKYGDNDWPTNEMISRGELRTFGVGCLIAILSGAALALGLLSDNIASLVGVAISTSLMPPAVNAGLLWSVASIYYLKGDESTRYSTLVYTNYYSDDRGFEIALLGCMSLCLTFANIIFIYIAGLIAFKVKEVAPIASRDHIKRHFWKHDIKVSRDFNKRGLTQSLSNLDHDIITGRHEYTWSPCMDFEIKPTIKELEEIYFNRLVNDTKSNSFIATICSPSTRKGYSTFNKDVTLPVVPDDVDKKESMRSNSSSKFVVTTLE
nr:uncharacterized protein LOC111420133 isoform X1 [Onthophagus taurus]